MKLMSFGKLNERSLVHTLVVTSCVGSTKASSEYTVFKGASIYKTDLYISTPGNNINNINRDKLFIILLFRHLEHLDSLRERYAYQLNSWVGCSAETWTLRATDQKRLESFDMWCWRRSFGPIM